MFYLVIWDKLVSTQNYLLKRKGAPLQVKLSVRHSCVMSSLTYSCETWSDVLPQEIESIFRMGLKTALSIRFNTCNEITYIESGMYPVSYGIKKRQMKFWSNLEESISGNSHPNTLIKKSQGNETSICDVLHESSS